MALIPAETSNIAAQPSSGAVRSWCWSHWHNGFYAGRKRAGAAYMSWPNAL